MARSSAGRARNDVVDAYRALLIFAVLCFHYLVRWAPPKSATDLLHYDRAYSPYWEIGAYGVEVFFVISGLVITMTILRSHDAFDFAFRRFSRLYPALVICAVLTFVLMTLAGPPPFARNIKDLLASTTFFAPLFGGQNVDGVYWSLTVEVKFYVLVAVSYLLLQDRFWMAIAGFAFAAAAARIAAFHHAFVGSVLIGKYISLFCTGMAVWYAIFEKRYAPALWLGMAALATLPDTLDILTVLNRSSLIAQAAVLTTIASLIAFLTFQIRLPLGPLPYLGRISYSLYLLHENIGVTIIGLVKQMTHCPDAVAFSIAGGVSVGLAALIFHFVEKPAQQWLREQYLRRRPQLAATERFAKAEA